MTSEYWKAVCELMKRAEKLMMNRQPPKRVPGTIVELDRKTYVVDSRGCYRRSV